MSNKIENPFDSKTDYEYYQIFNELANLKSRVDIKVKNSEKLFDIQGGLKFLPLAKVEIVLPNFKDMRGSEWSSWSHKSRSFQEIKALVKSAIDIARKNIEEIDIRNKDAVIHNNKVVESVKQLMVSIGVQPTYNSYELPTSRSRTRKSVCHQAGYIGDLSRTCPISNTHEQSKKIDSYLYEFNNWLAVEEEKDKKVQIEKDEDAIKKHVLNNPTLVSTLMHAGVNILSEIQTALPGKKAEVIEYCLVKAIDLVRQSTTPDEKLIESLNSLKHDIKYC
jgi:ribosomal protein L20